MMSTHGVYPEKRMLDPILCVLGNSRIARQLLQTKLLNPWGFTVQALPNDAYFVGV